MNDNKYLNEEKYKKIEKTLSIIAVLILIIGFCIGGYLISKGIMLNKANTIKVDTEKIAKSEDNLKNKIEELEAKKIELLSIETKKLEEKKAELISKGIKYRASAKYDDGEEYDLKIITNSLDPSFSYCSFNEYSDNLITKEYCLLKENEDENSKNIVAMKNVLSSSSYCNWNEYKNISLIQEYCSVNNRNESNANRMRKTEYIGIGVFVCFLSFTISLPIFVTAKRRSILAFTTQQAMPVAKEGINEMAPTIGNAAEKIAKGIKNGFSDENNNQ